MLFRRKGFLNLIYDRNPFLRLVYWPSFVLPILLISFLPLFAQAETDIVYLETAEKRLAITIELADTLSERSKGLMYRTELPAMTGMLFDFGKTGPVTMWMKNTRISLDMLFTDEAGKIIFIKRNAAPASEENISSPEPTRTVLEVAGGFADLHGVRIGDKLIHPLFAQD
jgi:uncharacterized membrane protein (UPF0127 family)